NMEDEEEFNCNHGVGLGEKGILPADKIPCSKAASLGPFAEKKNRSSTLSDERSSKSEYGVPGTLTDYMGDTLKDHYEIIPGSTEEKKQSLSQSDYCNKFRSCKGTENLMMASGNKSSQSFDPLVKFQPPNGKCSCACLRDCSLDLGNLHKSEYREVNSGACPAEKASVPLKASETQSSFEFYVSREEGINLFVDLSTSPSDWVKAMKNEVCALQHGFKNLANDTKCIRHLSIHNLTSGCDDSCQHGGFPQSLLRANNGSGLDNLMNMNGSLRSSPRTPCDISDKHIGCQEENKSQSFSVRAVSEAQYEMVSNIKSCNNLGEPIGNDLSGSDAFLIESAPGSSVNSISVECKSLKTSKHANEIGEDPTQRMNCSFVSAREAIPECFTNCSAELSSPEATNQNKDASSSPCNSDELPALVDPVQSISIEHCRLSNSSEPNPDRPRDHLPASNEQLETGSLSSGRQTSKCVPIDKSSGRNFMTHDSSECNEAVDKKRQLNDNDHDPIDCITPDAKILKISMHAGRVIVPRRSTRLVSK
ncbi:hypothetical protein RJ641_004661, partial [Dillenia turbinata]